MTVPTAGCGSGAGKGAPDIYVRRHPAFSRSMPYCTARMAIIDHRGCRPTSREIRLDHRVRVPPIPVRQEGTVVGAVRFATPVPEPFSSGTPGR